MPALSEASSPHPAELSVVIPVHDESVLLAGAVRGMLERLRALGAPFEIILIENGSTDATGDIARRIEHEAAEVRVLELPVDVSETGKPARGILRLWAESRGRAAPRR